ncbi:hypothetical protein JW998_15320 [candidate division KSB1 bacterium]|nr:hypothetical protein [candidate division KSB1 bacterium]
MWQPYHREWGSWRERIGLISCLEQFNKDCSFAEENIYLRISAKTEKLIISRDQLAIVFGDRFDASKMRIVDGFSQFETNAERFEDAVDQLGVNFDFSAGLYIYKNLPRRDDDLLAKFESYLRDKMDHSIDDFENMINNKYNDPDSWFQAALLLLLHPQVHNIDAAYKFFYKAADLSETANNRKFTAIAYLYTAYSAYILEFEKEANACVKKVNTLWPKLPEGWYLYAKLVCSSDEKIAVECAKKAVQYDKMYFIKIQADKDLNPIRLDLFRNQNDWMKKEVKSDFDQLDKLHGSYISLRNKAGDVDNDDIQNLLKYLSEQEDYIAEMRTLFLRGSYFDYCSFKDEFSKEVMEKYDYATQKIHALLKKREQEEEGKKSKVLYKLELIRQKVTFFCTVFILGLTVVLTMLLLRHFYPNLLPFFIFLAIVVPLLYTFRKVFKDLYNSKIKNHAKILRRDIGYLKYLSSKKFVLFQLLWILILSISIVLIILRSLGVHPVILPITAVISFFVLLMSFSKLKRQKKKLEALKLKEKL